MELIRNIEPVVRGGVEDTSLESKDTKNSEAKAKDSLFEDRPSRGQGQECSRPRTKDTAASVFKTKKRSSKKFFRKSPVYRLNQNFRLWRPKPQIKPITLETRKPIRNSNVSQTGVWRQNPQPLEALGSGGEAPSCWAFFL